MKGFKELKVWQKGIELVAMVYEITASFPGEEKYSNYSKSCGFQVIKCKMQNANRKMQNQFFFLEKRKPVLKEKIIVSLVKLSFLKKGLF